MAELHDPSAVLARVANSLSVACDWIESGKPDDLANAIELINHCIDDAQDLHAPLLLRPSRAGP